jgi:hypothetical protein
VIDGRGLDTARAHSIGEKEQGEAVGTARDCDADALALRKETTEIALETGDLLRVMPAKAGIQALLPQTG